MLTERQKNMLRAIPKAENHIHIEGSIPWDLALRLAEKNHVELPVHTVDEIVRWSRELITDVPVFRCVSGAVPRCFSSIPGLRFRSACGDICF